MAASNHIFATAPRFWHIAFQVYVQPTGRNFDKITCSHLLYSLLFTLRRKGTPLLALRCYLRTRGFIVESCCAIPETNEKIAATDGLTCSVSGTAVLKTEHEPTKHPSFWQPLVSRVQKGVLPSTCRYQLSDANNGHRHTASMSDGNNKLRHTASTGHAKTRTELPRLYFKNRAPSLMFQEQSSLICISKCTWDAWGKKKQLCFKVY